MRYKHYMKDKTENKLKALATLAISGEKKAYKELLLELNSLAYKFIRKKVSLENIAEDISQEILISVHKSLHTYDKNKAFLPWFYAIARYRINDHLRSHYSNLETNPFEDWIENKADNSNEREEIEKNQAIEKALLSLSDKYKRIVQLLYLEGFSVKEISLEMGISESDVKTSAHRALKQIKSEFGGRK